MGKTNPYQVAIEQVQRWERSRAWSRISSTSNQTKRELTVNFPVKMDDGHVKVFTGCASQA